MVADSESESLRPFIFAGTIFRDVRLSSGDFKVWTWSARSKSWYDDGCVGADFDRGRPATVAELVAAGVPRKAWLPDWPGPGAAGAKPFVT